MTLTTAQIGVAGLTSEKETRRTVDILSDYSFGDFIYGITKRTWGKYSEADLMKQYGKQLNYVYKLIKPNISWLHANPNLEDGFGLIEAEVANIFMDEVGYTVENITNEVEIHLLNWNVPEPIMSLSSSSGALFKFMPRIDTNNPSTYQRHPEDIELDFFSKQPGGNNIDPQNISYNYVPYKMDSEFERKAIEAIVKLTEMAGLEVYFNGYKDSNLDGFWIQTPDGVYTPDFLVLRRVKGQITKVLVVETKGGSYYDAEFKRKERFVKEVFTKHNPNFFYECFVDQDGKNDFEAHIPAYIKLLEKLRD
jgi:hypothetical protein